MLADFVNRTMAEPFAWGRNDCALWAASAVEHCTGIDPAADLRGTYASAFECRRIVMRAGGLRRLACDLMDPVGLEEIAGDGVAVARADGQVICGLVLGGRFAARTEQGLRFFEGFDLLRGWSCRRL